MESESTLDSLDSVSDDELLRRLSELVSHSRRVEADLVSHIGEVEERRLYAREASPSMFAYCTGVLHLSEAEAYLRITVARAAREHPLLLTMLGDGRLHLSGIVKLVPILTRENRDGLLKRATHRSKRQILELVAELSPRPDVPSLMRKLPQRRPAPVLGAPLGPSQVWRAVELGPDRVEIPLRRRPHRALDRPVRVLSNSVRTELRLVRRLATHGLDSAGQGPSSRSRPSDLVSRHGRRSWSRSRPTATKSSSPPAPSSATSSSGSLP